MSMRTQTRPSGVRQGSGQQTKDEKQEVICICRSSTEFQAASSASPTFKIREIAYAYCGYGANAEFTGKVSDTVTPYRHSGMREFVEDK